MEEAEKSFAYRLFSLGWWLAVGLLRLSLVFAAYLGTAIAGFTFASTLADPVAMLLGAVLGPVAITAGFVAWLSPSWRRSYGRSNDPELDYAKPTRLDAVWFLSVTTVLCTVGATLMGPAGTLLPELVFAGIGFAGSLVIVITGGRRIAELWVALLGMGAMAALQ